MRTKYPISNRDMCGLYEFRKLPVGSKVWFAGEKQGFTVRASNVAFCVLTKPFNAQKTVLYTIIDWESGVRGAEDLIFGMGAETAKECRDMLKRVTNGESGISHRRFEDLIIVKYWNPTTKKFYEIKKESDQLPGQTNIEEELEKLK